VPEQPRPDGPQESEPPNLALLLIVVLQGVNDVLDEVEDELSEHLALRLYALRSAVRRYREAHEL
jgi:hypothetical protein